MKKKKKTGSGKVRLLKYEKTALKVDTLGLTLGLTFPDNFMAIMGWRRVK